MENPTTQYTLEAGNYEIAVGSTVIPAQLLGDITVTIQEGELSTETQAGVNARGSGKIETATATFNLFLPAEDPQRLLSAIWPDNYNAPTAEAQKSGNVTFGSGACKTRTPQPVNIHNVCSTTDDNDYYAPAAISKVDFTPTLSTSEVSAFEVTMYLNEDANGMRLRFGTGDLSQPSRYDPTTQKTVPVTPAAE